MNVAFKTSKCWSPRRSNANSASCPRRQTLLDRIRSCSTRSTASFTIESPASEYEPRIALSARQMARALYDELGGSSNSWRLTNGYRFRAGDDAPAFHRTALRPTTARIANAIVVSGDPRKAMIEVGQPIGLTMHASAYDHTNAKPSRPSPTAVSAITDRPAANSRPDRKRTRSRVVAVETSGSRAESHRRTSARLLIRPTTKKNTAVAR